MLSELDMKEVYKHYQKRLKAHRELKEYMETEDIENYVKSALGITNPDANYSAFDHFLGPKIIEKNPNPIKSVFYLGKKIFNLPSASRIPLTIYDEKISYLKISVGSEMAMMLNPDKFWVGNLKTIYSHLLLKYGGDKSKAGNELKLYIDGHW